MASTKEMQARAKAKSTVFRKDEKVVAVVTSYDSIEEMNSDIDSSITRGASALQAQMSESNVDMTLLDTPTLQGKKITLGGKKFEVVIHCDNKAVQAIARVSKRDLGAVIQIWNGAQSAILTISNEAMEDARYNWRREARIKHTDRLSQAVSAFRLMAPDAASHHLAMHLAYDHKEVDAAGCHSVWD